MNTKTQPRFDVDALRNLAGEKVFARGKEYHRGGQVEILFIEPRRVVAQVAGTEDYRTVMTGAGKSISGECSCPASEQWGFCKHMVAVALAANDAKAGAGGTLERIRGNLKSKDVDALVEMIVNLAERDVALYRKLEMAAALGDSDDRTLEASLRKAIDKATQTHGYVDYGDMREWAAEVDEVLDAIAALVAGKRYGLALKLVDHALSKVEKAMESLDDSDGHCGGLLHRLGEMHLAVCEAMRPDPVKLAKELFDREVNAPHDVFYDAAAHYSGVLGEAGLAEYRRLTVAAWEKLPPRAQKRGARPAYDSDYETLKRLMDFFAGRDGDVAAQLALRKSDLSSPWDYLELAEFCLAQGQEDDALKHAEEGLWVFEDERTDERLVDFAVKLLIKKKRKQDAEALLWRTFEKSPGFELYGKLRSAGGASVRQRAIAFLEARLASEKPSQWHFPSSLLIEVLMAEKMLAQAWQIASRHGAAGDVMEQLAMASEATHPAQSLAVFARRVEELVNTGAGYEEAARLIARMGRLRSAAEQAAYVRGLRETYRRKRNFMKLLG
jgi:uncharacterized Zn finger protein